MKKQKTGTRTRELQLEARANPSAYIRVGRTLVIGVNGYFLPIFGGLESTGMACRINLNGQGWKGDRNDRKRALIASRNRRLTLRKKLPPVYLP